MKVSVSLALHLSQADVLVHPCANGCQERTKRIGKEVGPFARARGRAILLQKFQQAAHEDGSTHGKGHQPPPRAAPMVSAKPLQPEQRAQARIHQGMHHLVHTIHTVEQADRGRFEQAQIPHRQHADDGERVIAQDVHSGDMQGDLTDLPKSAMLLGIFKTCSAQRLNNPFLLHIHGGTQFFERGVLVAQFHIDEAQEHHRVFRQVVCHEGKNLLVIICKITETCPMSKILRKKCGCRKLGLGLRVT